MSLADLINNRLNLEVVTESNCYVDNKKLGNKGGYTIWIDSIARNMPHFARVKVYPNHNMSGKYFNLRLSDMTVTNKNTLPDDVSMSDFSKLVTFLSRTAIREALLNVMCVEKCKLSPDALAEAITELSSSWKRQDRDDYEKDLAIIQKYAKASSGADYIPVPLSEILK